MLEICTHPVIVFLILCLERVLSYLATLVSCPLVSLLVSAPLNRDVSCPVLSIIEVDNVKALCVLFNPTHLQTL